MIKKLLNPLYLLVLTVVINSCKQKDGTSLHSDSGLMNQVGDIISNKDVEMVNKLLGEVAVLTNPQAANEKLAAIDAIFQKSEDQVVNVFTAFRDRDSYMNEAQYKKAMSVLGEDANNTETYKFGTTGRAFNVRMGQNGRMIYSLKTK